MLKMNISCHVNSENLLIKVVTLKAYMEKKTIKAYLKGFTK